MSFVNRLALISPGFGSPITNDSLLLSAGNSLSDGANTITLGSLAPTVRSGWVRVKCYNGTGTSPAVSTVVITATDGTTTETIYVRNPAAATAISTTAFVDFIVPFLLEINANSFSFVITMTGTGEGGKADIEIAPCS
jgi:hypothetical protein